MLKKVSALYSSIDEVAKEKLAPFSTLSNDESYQSRDLEKVLYLEADILLLVIWSSLLLTNIMDLQITQQLAKPLYDAKVQPSTLIPKQVGNMYTASLYAAFISLLHNKRDSLVYIFSITYIHIWLLCFHLSKI